MSAITAVAGALAPAMERPSVRCEYCRLMQYYIPEKPFCRKCHRPLDVSPPPEPKAEAVVEPPIPIPRSQGFLDLPTLLRDIREARGISQEGLGNRMGVPRSHITKIENGRVFNLRFLTFEQYARGLGTRGSSIAAFLEDPSTKPAKRLACVDETLLQHVGPTLRRMRERAEKSREDIHSVTRMALCYMSRVETGKTFPGILFFWRIASAIGTTPSAIFAEIENAAFPNG